MYDSESPYLQITKEIKTLGQGIADTRMLNNQNGNFMLPYRYAGVRDNKYVKQAKNLFGKPGTNACYIVFSHHPNVNSQEGIGRDGQYAQFGLVEIQIFADVGMGVILPGQILSDISKGIKELPQVNWTDLDIGTPERNNPGVGDDDPSNTPITNMYNLTIPYRYDYLLDNIV